MDHCCKVGRLIAEYDLKHRVRDTDIDDYLLSRWLGQDEYTTTGLRPLKDWFNQQLLKRVYNDQDRSTLETRVQSDYEALTGDETDLAVLDDLRADEIDGDQLQSDFVSTATLYRHFTKCLDESKSNNEPQENSKWEEEKIEYAKDIVQTNVEESLHSLENKGRLSRGSQAEIKTEIVLGCPECPTQASFDRALQRGYVCQKHMDEEVAVSGPADDHTNDGEI